ncbi:hypothetical protein L873DRAFT_1826799 [Choiromyces venosus 120613-1]|uniref:F-box domain-containing protein n=1 Tax=Choiromyces venosus 120613-1 TaxID=1336337 RepID=A0A3N4JW59_9PEZI|nr:hypothetical protein L873DRAFT_1826799 [Choiromyces venosus 120613-1]
MERIVRKMSSLSYLVNRPVAATAAAPPPAPPLTIELTAPPPQQARRASPALPILQPASKKPKKPISASASASEECIPPPAPPGAGPVTLLPTEILLQIFARLPAAKDLGVATRVCRRWYATGLEILYREVEVGRFGLGGSVEHKLFVQVAGCTFRNPELCAIVKKLTLRSQSFINSTHLFPKKPLSHLTALGELTWLAVDLVLDPCQSSPTPLYNLVNGLRLPQSIRKLHVGLRYYVNAERGFVQISPAEWKERLPLLEEFRYTRIRLWSELIGKQELVEEEAQGTIVAVNDDAAGESDKLGEMDKSPALFQTIVSSLSALTTLKTIVLDCPLNPACFTYTLTPALQQETHVNFLAINSFLYPPNITTPPFGALDREVSQKAQSSHNKLLRLSNTQLHELSVDVSDETARRIATTNDETASDMPPYLPDIPTFHPRRNQARQKLATLRNSRFADLLTDVAIEIRARYPRICTLRGFVPAPEFPGSGKRGGRRAHRYVTERMFETLEEAGLRDVACVKARLGTGDSEWVRIDIFRYGGENGKVEVASLVPPGSAKVLNEGIKVVYSYGGAVVESVRRGVLEELGGGRWRVAEALEL